jgi:hypothetical protein
LVGGRIGIFLGSPFFVTTPGPPEHGASFFFVGRFLPALALFLAGDDLSLGCSTHLLVLFIYSVKTSLPARAAKAAHEGQPETFSRMDPKRF